MRVILFRNQFETCICMHRAYSLLIKGYSAFHTLIDVTFLHRELRVCAVTLVGIVGTYLNVLVRFCSLYCTTYVIIDLYVTS
jgi:hypothetical protein